MKNNMPVLASTFAAGIIIGAAIAWMVIKDTSAPPVIVQKGPITADTAGIRLISASTANLYFKAYLSNFISIDTLKGFTINAQQYNSMKRIEKADTSVTGFRIYLGMDNQTPVRMVVGTGSPDHDAVIYATDAPGSGPCPTNCDTESPITKK